MPIAKQLSLFDPDGPQGLRYQGDLIGTETETHLASQIAALPLQPFAFHGHVGNRRVASFGWRYDYSRRAVEEAAPPPAWLAPLRELAAAFAGLPAEDFRQVLVSEYAPGAGIGWHRDKPQFGVVVGVSLLSDCPLRFRRRQGERWERKTVQVARRSAYLLSGEARSLWEHSIRPVDSLRYSVTFRTLATPRMANDVA